MMEFGLLLLSVTGGGLNPQTGQNKSQLWSLMQFQGLVRDLWLTFMPSSSLIWSSNCFLDKSVNNLLMEKKHVQVNTQVSSSTCVIDISVFMHRQQHFLVGKEAINEITAAMQRNEITKLQLNQTKLKSV